MNSTKNTEKYVRIIMLPLFAFMLVLSTVLPSVTLAADDDIVVTVEPGMITQDDINAKSTTIKLTLAEGQSWVENIETQGLIMEADADEDAWNAYKKGISISNTPQILVVTLPKAAYHITANQKITMNLPIVLIEDEQETEKFVSASFVIEHSGTSILTVVPTSMTEAGVQTGKATISLKLDGNKWVIDTEAKKQVLINALVAKNQPEQWKKVKDALIASSVSSVKTSGAENDTVTITIPSAADYELSTNQTISLNLPPQLLENSAKINGVEFTVEATPKVLISGTVTPKVSQADIIKGGKTIVVTLVNAKWDDAIASNITLREKLLQGFALDSYTDIINAEANVVRTNDQAVTITLPPLAGFKIGADTPIAFDEKSITASETLSAVMPNAFTITPTTNQSATISGSIVGANEFDIVQGDREIIVTLKNDSWTTDPTKFEIFKSGFIATGDNPVNLSAKKVERTSDTVLTITLQEVPFTLTEDITAKLTIPTELLASSGNPITTTAFKITAVKAELPSGKDLVFDKLDIQKGGKIISITLKNAIFKENLEIDKALINGIFTTSNPIVTALENNPTNISITKNKITIKLPPVPDYDSLTADILDLKIPSGLIDHDKAKEIVVDGKITTGAVAIATLHQKPISSDQIKAGNITFELTLTGTEWDPTLLTNKSKKTALLKGFTVIDQTKEWALLSKEISTNGEFELSANQQIITITVPAVPGYSIIRDQVVNIKIPKSVLMNYKEDLTVTEPLTITVPTFVTGGMSLDELTAEELAKAIENNNRLIVPSKKVETIYVNTVEYPGTDKENPNITTIEVTAAAGVKTVQVVVAGSLPQTIIHSGNAQSKSTFIYTGLEKNSELEIVVFGDGPEPLQSTIYKKIGKGSKTYNEIPKKNLAGSYLLYDILTQKSLLKDILKYYSIDELKVTS